MALQLLLVSKPTWAGRRHLTIKSQTFQQAKKTANFLKDVPAAIEKISVFFSFSV